MLSSQFVHARLLRVL